MSEKPPQKEGSSEFLGTKKHMKRGLSLFKKGEYRRAAEQFELIRRHDKKYVRTYNNLGYIYRKLGEYEKALEIWEEGLKVDPSYRRLQKNITSLRRSLEARKGGPETPPIAIEDFEVGVDWLSENAELTEIREGRFFDVYIIEDEGRQHAFKTPGKLLPARQEIFDGFEHACSDWLKLPPSAYVVNATSIEWVSGRPFVAMECLSEGSLRDLLGTDRLSLAQTLELAVQACLGLHFIHAELGVAHGDVRPENLLLYGAAGETEGVVESRPGYYFLKVSDVGLYGLFQKAELLTDPEGRLPEPLAGEGLVRTPSEFFTPFLFSCAPELLESLDIPNELTDIFSFGVVLYEMLTGMLPFSGSSPEAILRTMRQGRPEHPSLINTRVPFEVGAIAMRCLEMAPEARFESFYETAQALINYLMTSRSAFIELSDLFKRYKKISRFQYLDEERNSSVMIVGGTEFSSEVSQLWEILTQRANREMDSDLKQCLARIEKALSLPGMSIGEIHPTVAGLTEGLTLVPPEEYLDSLKGVSAGSARDRPPELSTPSPVEEESGSDGGSIDRPERKPFSADAARQYVSLVDAGDEDGAARLLADILTRRAHTVLLESATGHELLSVWGSLYKREPFCRWLKAVFRELPPEYECSSPADFLEDWENARADAVAAICGLVFMLGSEFSTALEAFNMVPEERYLPALAIYMWAMAAFQSEKMAELRVNSLRNASNLLKEIIAANERQNKRSTIVQSSHHKGYLADAFFLRGLVLERLGEHKQAVAHFRAWKRLLRKDPSLPAKKLPWTNLFQGKSMYEVGMPSEAFLRWQRVITSELAHPFFEFLDLGADSPRVILSNHVHECCEAAISRFADNAMLWCVKGKLLNGAERHDEALHCSERALEVDENFYAANFLKMEACLRMGRVEDALEALRLYAIREPYEPSLMLREAELLSRLGEPSKALNEVRRAIEYGIDVSMLRSSIEKGRLSSLEELEGFKAITEHLRGAQ